MTPRVHHTPAGRDAAVVRLRRLNRGLIAVAVAGAAVLTEVAASAFPGHTIKRAAQSTALKSGSSQTTTVHHKRRVKAAVVPLQAPTTPPSSSSTDESAPTASVPNQQTAPVQQTAPAQSAPAQSTPTPVYVAPAPVVSGGS